MKQQTFLHIPEPCHENWDSMTPEGRGRFCASCAKTVVDFTAMTDVQVLNYLKTIKGNTCGRLKEDQLARAMTNEETKKRTVWQWVLTTLTTISLTNKIQAQTPKGAIKPDTTTTRNFTPIILGKIAPGILAEPKRVAIPVTGTVTNEAGEPLAGAAIEINGERNVVTDDKGKFHFELTTKRNDIIKLTASYMGYTSQKKLVGTEELKEPLNIQLKQDVRMLEDVTVVSQNVISCKYPIPANSKIVAAGGLSVVTNVSYIDTVVSCAKQLFGITSVFPNPANKGSQINIKLKDAGDYAIQLLNNGGSFISQQTQSGAAEKQVLPFSIPSNIAAGNYYIRIINNTTKKQSTEKIIVL
ncbi:MAG: carboxypeptidase-like regulatory domain-containing protein [Filimonas sp.]|nr:carboxypeptidase-like regulatory domain-containing protein [Filimonas sp.]